MTAVHDGRTVLRDAILRLVAGAADGLSDAELRSALASSHPGLRAQRVNQLCRHLVATGALERVGTRPIRNRTPTGASGVPPLTPSVRKAPRSTPFPRVPVRDATQAWTRPVNVAATVGAWLVGHGATVGRTDPGGHGLVAALHGDDVRVEVLGWPGDRRAMHPVTLADDWFATAVDMLGRRRRVLPRARLAVALPDTRRYRTLAAACPALVAARVEVWFVDEKGAVHPVGEPVRAG